MASYIQQVESTLSPASSYDNAQSPHDQEPPAKKSKKDHTRIYQACEPCRKRKVGCKIGDVDNPGKPPCARCKREHKACTFAAERRKTKKKSNAGEADDRVPDRSGPTRTYYTSPSSPPTPDQAVASQSPMAPLMVDSEVAHRATAPFKQETLDTTAAMNALLDAANLIKATEANVATAFKNHPAEVVQAARRAWSRVRFVRLGWFTADEGMAYVEYFYVHCLPLSPISIPNYRDISTHALLLAREPILLVTILMIASRFMTLEGHGGKVTRPAMIHERIWSFFRQTQFPNLFFAQERPATLGQLGGNVELVSDSLARYGVRSYSTVEALLLLTEWHPRALHFQDDDQILSLDDSTDHGEVGAGAQTGDRYDSWLAPSRRSNRMVWNLLNFALGLAYDLGVFDDKTTAQMPEAALVSFEERMEFDTRKATLKKLLWIFYTQTSGRLEIADKLPKGLLDTLHNLDLNKHVQEAVKLSQATGVRYPPVPMFASQYLPTVDDAIDHFWVGIAAIIKAGNETMFGNADRARGVVMNNDYREYIQKYGPLLDDWLSAFQGCQLIQEPMRSILRIEFEYARMYLNSLTLQAFVNRCIASTPSKQMMDHHDPHRDEFPMVPLETVRAWMQEDAPYIQELVDACQKVLSIIADGTLSPSHLKHLPVRTYFRVMTSSVFLLKSFVVGAYADNVARSLSLLQKASIALRDNIVDDIHIGNVFADMMTSVASTLLVRLVRFPSANGTGTGTGKGFGQDASGVAPHNGDTTAGAERPNTLNARTSNGFGMGELDNSSGFNNLAQIDHLDTDAFVNHIPIYNPDHNPRPVMPPPHEFTHFGDGQLYPDFGGNGMVSSNQQQERPPWIGMDLTGLVNMTGKDDNVVTNTQFGPILNGQDILQHLINDDFFCPGGMQDPSYLQAWPANGANQPHH